VLSRHCSGRCLTRPDKEARRVRRRRAGECLNRGMSKCAPGILCPFPWRLGSLRKVERPRGIGFWGRSFSPSLPDRV
jgi:hypothetical protein